MKYWLDVGSDELFGACVDRGSYDAVQTVGESFQCVRNVQGAFTMT